MEIGAVELKRERKTHRSYKIDLALILKCEVVSSSPREVMGCRLETSLYRFNTASDGRMVTFLKTDRPDSKSTSVGV